MQPVDTLAVFFMASVLLALTPGPDNLFVLAQSAQRGKMAGLAVTVGLCTGLLVHTSAVALGVAALFKTSAIAFALLKYIGAAYLVYLACGAFRAADDSKEQTRVKKLGFGKLYRRGIIMNVTNPKVSIFFLAFLPQFTDPQYGALLPQTIILGLLFILSTVLVFGGISFLAGGLGDWLRRNKKAETILHRLTGIVFIGLAARLALSHR